MASKPKTVIIKKFLYGGNVEIDFYPNSHMYKLMPNKDGLISATQMTGILDKPHILPWALGIAKSHLLNFLEGKGALTPEELYPVINEAIEEAESRKKEAGDIGTQIHDWCEGFAKSKIEGVPEPEITDEIDERVLNGISAFLDFYNSHDVKFLEYERFTYSMIHGWCGKFDSVAMVDGIKTIIDYKTGKYIYDEQYFQMGQYWISIDEENEYLRANPDGSGRDFSPIQQGMILNFRKEDDEVLGKGGDLTIGILSQQEQLDNTPSIKALHTLKKRLKEFDARRASAKKEASAALKESLKDEE